MKYIYSLFFVIFLSINGFAMGGNPPRPPLTPNVTNDCSVITRELYCKYNSQYPYGLRGYVSYKTLGYSIAELNERKKIELMNSVEYFSYLERIKADDEKYLNLYLNLTYYATFANVGRDYVNLNNVKVFLVANDDIGNKRPPDYIIKSDVIFHEGDESDSTNYKASPIIKFSRKDLPSNIEKLTLYIIIGDSNTQMAADL